MTSAETIQLVIMLVIFLGITAVGSIALYRAGRPGWWLPIVFMAGIVGWPLVKNAIF